VRPGGSPAKPEPANVLGPPARVPTSCRRSVASDRGSLSLLCQCLESHLMLTLQLGRETGRDRRVRPGGLPKQGTSLWLLAQLKRRMRSSSCDSCNRKGSSVANASHC
jgi:hypothetical protein